jgi:hypothetical protein
MTRPGLLQGLFLCAFFYVSFGELVPLIPLLGQVRVSPLISIFRCHVSTTRVNSLLLLRASSSHAFAILTHIEYLGTSAKFLGLGVFFARFDFWRSFWKWRSSPQLGSLQSKNCSPNAIYTNLLVQILFVLIFDFWLRSVAHSSTHMQTRSFVVYSENTKLTSGDCSTTCEPHSSERSRRATCASHAECTSAQYCGNMSAVPSFLVTSTGTVIPLLLLQRMCFLFVVYHLHDFNVDR